MSRQTEAKQTRHDDAPTVDRRRPPGTTRHLRLVEGQTGPVDQPGSHADVRDYLRLVSEASEELLQVAAVGFALADRRGELQVVASGRDEVLDLGQRELRDGLGPAVDCYATGRPVVNIDRAEARRRWSTISTLLAEAGFGSLHTLPLRADGQVIGVLSLYFGQRRVLRTDELNMCQTVIHAAGTRLRRARAAGPPHGDPPRPPGERYQVGELIGRGGMADVHLARDVNLGRAVAIKTPRADRTSEPGLVERFRREGRTGARLEHPSIVSVLGTGDDEVSTSHRGGGRCAYIVMEHVDGVTLRTLVGAGGGLKVDEALRITGDILCALTYAHEQGVVHGDVTATNVMLSTDGAVKLMDFGSSHAVTGSDMGETQSVDVTPAYVSPERAQGLAIDTRADLYSMGCVLYELLTGRALFAGDSAVDLAYRHVHEEPQPPSTHRPEIGAELDAVVLRALAKAPGARYQSALEFRVDLLAAGVHASRLAAVSGAP